MKYVLLLVLVAMLSVNCFAAQWVGLKRDSSTEAGKVLAKDNGSEVVVDVSIPGYKFSLTKINGEDHTVLDLNGSTPLLKKGYPELRKVTAFIKIPKCAAVSVSMLDGKYVSKEVAPVAPSKGNVLRNIMPEDVPYTFSDSYTNGEWYPADSKLVEVSKPFKLRDVWGVRLTVKPFQYNNGTKTLKIYTDMKVSIKPEGVTKDLNINLGATSSDFKTIYKNVFMNYNDSQTRGYSAPELRKNLLIVAGDKYYEAAKKLKVWKSKIGFDVELKKMSDIGSTGYDLKSYFGQKYQENKLCHIILIGDSKDIPTLKGLNERADSDNCMVKLDGNDNIVDAFISRISVETAAQAEYVIMKSINYEKYPMQGNDAKWYKSALGIASNQGSPKDYERINAIHDPLKSKLGFEITDCYDQGYSSADKNIITKAVNKGVSIIDYCGHGSETMWVSSRFNSSDAKRLSNGMKLPLIWSVACVNGKYVGRECFAEAWLRSGSKDSPAGCIGMAAASTNMAWVPPCVWQKHIILDETIKGKHMLVGVQNVYGILKTMEEYGIDNSSAGNQLSEQLHFFGDGTVTLRIKAPRVVQVEKSITKDADGNEYLTVKASDDLSGCSVSAYDDRTEKVETVKFDGRNTAMIPINRAEMTHFTVFGADIVPIVDEEI